MPDEQKPPSPEEMIPVAEIRPARNISVAWLVPLVAVIIAGWLVYSTIASKGPTITISFLNAEGLEPEKTKIKYKEIEIGTVTEIAIAEDLDGVIVTADLKKGTEKYLTDQTKFWVAKAHVSVKEVRDLGTLLSGAYIGVDPAVEGNPQNEFIGLERPPAVSNTRPGRFFSLYSESLGSLSIGSPIFYRQIEVGQVTDYRINDDYSGVIIDIFIEAPFHELVRENSHFWNASGVRIDLSPAGIEVKTDSLISIFLGGIAFDSPLQDRMEAATAGETFQLYPDKDQIKDRKYTVRKHVLAYFNESVRGLSPGAAVEFKGIKVGKVEKILPEIDEQNGDFRVKTILAIEPQRIVPDKTAEEIMERNLPLLVAKGLRAQLATNNFLTGQLYVDLNFHGTAAPAELGNEEPYPQFPTVSSTTQRTLDSITRILAKLEQIPMDRLGTELTKTFHNLNSTLAAVQVTLDKANTDLSPAITETLEQFQITTRALQADFDGDSALQYQLQELLQELQMTSRSLRTLTDYLERKPQSVIFGKDEVKP